MPLSNDMTLLINKIERRLGLIPLEPHLPEFCQKDKWGDIIMQDTMVSFSRYYPNKMKFLVNDETCYKKKDPEGTIWYYIKDEVLQGNKILGGYDINWSDTTNNVALGATSLGGGWYYPNYGCLEGTYESILALQGISDVMSLYNRQVYIEFRPPNNRFCIKGVGNANYDLTQFTMILLVEHRSLSTISPTMMEIFEKLAMADIATFLYQNLKFWDGLDTAFVNLDFKLSELDKVADTREQVIEEIKNSYVSTSSDAIPYLWTV